MYSRKYRRNVLASAVLLLLILLNLSYQHTAQAQNVQMSNTQTALLQKEFTGGPFVLKASEIDGEDAHLQLFPNLLYPILTFSSANIYNMNLSHPITDATALVIASPGPVISIGVAIKTSTWQDLKVSLGRISAPDLLILLAGGTVKHLTLKDVTMNIDIYLNAQSLTIPNCQIQII